MTISFWIWASHEFFTFFCGFFLAPFLSAEKGYHTQMLRTNFGTNTWRMDGVTGKTKNCVSDGGELWWPSFTCYHLVGHLECQPSPEITKMAIKPHRVNIDLQQKTNPIKLWSIFNFNIISSILNFSHYEKSQDWHLGKTRLSFGQSLTST